MKVTFITGNQHKADLLAKFLGYPVEHLKLELDEIQSLDPRKVTEHKARQAYEITKAPILVEDVCLIFNALGRLPGPFIKWFEEELELEGICRLLDKFDDRSAVASVTFAYFDGTEMKLFEGSAKGQISKDVRSGDNSFGWNSIFVPDGHTKSYVEMSDKEQAEYGLRQTTVFPEIKKFLSQLDTN